MEFHRPSARPQRENILPMINVVFLLLIFFLLTAHIAPPAPFEITPPESGSQAQDLPARTLWLGEDGQLIHEDLSGEAALAALAAGEGPVLIRADAGLAAADLARLMGRLAALGIHDLRLGTLSRGAP